MEAAAPESQALLPTTPEVIDRLVKNHRQFLAFLERRLGSRSVAEDILQESFVRSMDKLDALQNEESAVAWFYRMLRNAVIDHHRRSATRRRGLDAFARELDMHVTPESEVRSVICHCIGELAATLKPEYAEVLHRVEVDEMALNDYASEAGISAGNAAVRAFRAREALRKQVARSCGTCAEHGCLDCTCDASPAHFASKRDASRA